jgi:hypothetical protein
MSNESIKWIRCFNSKFEEFLKDLIETFPEDKDFVMSKQSYCLLKMLDETKPFYMFRVYCMKYKEQIMTRDERFFLDHDFAEEQADDQTNLSEDLLHKLKGYWMNMSSSNRDTIWQYLNLLYKLEEKINI